MVRQTSAPDMGARRIVRTGSFGEVPAEQATALAMALVELLANAVEHGADDVELRSARDEVGLHVVVSDRGPGFPEGFEVASSPRLGLRIVDTLVREELNGTLTLGRVGEVTEVAVDLPPEQR
jgi:two-component sensor histidine kinase